MICMMHRSGCPKHWRHVSQTWHGGLCARRVSGRLACTAESAAGRAFRSLLQADVVFTQPRCIHRHVYSLVLWMLVDLTQHLPRFNKTHGTSISLLVSQSLTHAHSCLSWKTVQQAPEANLGAANVRSPGAARCCLHFD